MNHTKKNEILLESGTNELEIMEFTVDGEVFGINVAKVLEIMKMIPIKPMQNAHPDIEGIFKPRESVITVVDLAKYLHLQPSKNPERDIFIITNFNNLTFAFHVHTVEGIDRISWSKIQKPDTIIYGSEGGVATGIAEYDGRLITILDFEKIITEICPETGIQYSDLDRLGQRNRSDKQVLVVEDSSLLSKMIVESLHRSGYVHTFKANNGQEAWDFLCELKKVDKPILDQLACVVTDIEMPLMDGHRLTRLIKEDEDLCNLPVILFSSLINREMMLKGQQLGADAQITKPQIADLVYVIDQITSDPDRRGHIPAPVITE